MNALIANLLRAKLRIRFHTWAQLSRHRVPHHITHHTCSYKHSFLPAAHLETAEKLAESFAPLLLRCEIAGALQKKRFGLTSKVGI